MNIHCKLHCFFSNLFVKSINYELEVNGQNNTLLKTGIILLYHFYLKISNILFMPSQ